jgi:hypothetical protein
MADAERRTRGNLIRILLEDALKASPYGHKSTGSWMTDIAH